MKLGDIIEFEAEAGEFRLGAIVGEVGAKKLIVQTADGAQMRPLREQVSQVLSTNVAHHSAASTLATLQELEQEVAAREADVDLEVLWSFAAGGGSFGVEPLTRMVFGAVDEIASLAMLRRLRADEVYFRHRRDRWEPRSEDQVDELREQIDRERRKVRAREDFIETLASLLEGPPSSRGEAIYQRTDDEDFVERLDLLQAFAAGGEQYELAEIAGELLGDLEARLGRKLKSSGQWAAFHLMVDLGVWDEHENLALQRFNVKRRWQEELLAEAQRLAEAPFEPEPWRRDMTSWFTCTIDDAETCDIDDALSWRPTLGGGWEVAVHIADPSARVPIGSPLDEAARQSSTSIYPPSGVVPMFPRILSESAMSLLAGEIRPAITTLIRIEDDLSISHTEIFPSTVRVDSRLTYEEADMAMDGAGDPSLQEALVGLSFVADELMLRRFDNGAVSIDLPEAKVRVDRAGPEPKVRVKVLSKSPSRDLVGELMIFTNRLMAEFCYERDIPIIYRTQEPPDGDPEHDPEILALPEGPAREFAKVKRMRRGDISVYPSPHSGLGVPLYVQASSPIRRYSDLVTQRQLKAHLAGEPLPYDRDSILDVAGAVERAAYEASVIERESTRYWIIYLLEQLQEQPLDAVVVDHRDDKGTRATIFLTDFAYRANCSFRNPAPLGHAVKVMVERADPRKEFLSLRQA